MQNRNDFDINISINEATQIFRLLTEDRIKIDSFVTRRLSIDIY